MKAYGWSILLLFALPACSDGAGHGGPLDGGASGAGGGAGAGMGTGGAGGGPGISCDSFTPCGGDITGTWTIAHVCGYGPGQTQPIMNCPGGTATLDVTVTGTLSFGTDGSYTTMLTMSGTALETLPKGCLGGVACDMLQDALRQSATIAAATCVDDGANCQCNLTFAPTPNTATGLYTVSGGSLTTTPSNGGMPGMSRFCVAGNQLSIAPSDPQSKIMIVATK
jgi:hypothetical protein